MAVFQKSDFRKFCLNKLSKILPSQKRRGNQNIVKILKNLIELIDAKSILFYMPLKHEPDIRPLINYYRRKKDIFLPFMEGKSFKMVKYRLPLITKQFGIKEPANSFYKLSKIDLAVVPVVGVDRNFRRIGFGKGMYDRFFGNLSYRPIVIFVEIKKCFTKSKITDDFDILGDIYITPEEIIIRGDSDVVRNFGRKFCRHNKWRCRIFDSKKDRKK